MKTVHFRRSRLEISSSNGVDGEIKEIKNENDEVTKIVDTPVCLCGQKCGDYPITDEASIIIERMHTTRLESEKSGNPPRYEYNYFHEPIVIHCQCGRQFSHSLNEILEKVFYDAFVMKYEAAKETFVLGKRLTFDVEIEGGCFPQPHPNRLLTEIINPLHHCGETLHPEKLYEAAQEMINVVNNLFQNGVISKWETKTDETTKCRYCLGTAKVKSKIHVSIPKNNSPINEIITAYEEWKNRIVE